MSSPGADHARTKGTAIGGGAFVSQGVERFVLGLIDLDRPRPVAEPVPTGFLPHGFALHPTRGSVAAAFEKHGPGACEVDLASRRVLREIATTPTRSFYGHGAYSADGSLLYATETHRDTRAGALVVRDALSLVELGELPTHGRAPHDCALIEGGVLAVTHGGGALSDPAPEAAPCVTWIELASGRLLDRMLLPSPGINAGHLALGARGGLALASAPRDGLSPDEHLGGLTLRAAGGAPRLMSTPPSVVERMKGETLSVLFDEARDLVVATNPLGDLLSFWRGDGRSVGAMRVRAPRGIGFSLDGDWLLVSHLSPLGPRLTVLDAKSLSPKGFYVEPSFFTGSHLAVCAV